MFAERRIRYELVPIPTGVRIVWTSEHDDLGKFAELSKASLLSGHPNEHWEHITNWRIGEFEIVVPAMARQTHTQTAEWFSTILNNYPPERYYSLHFLILNELLMFPRSYTIRHLKQWEQANCFQNSRNLLVRLLANKGKRATAWLNSVIEDYIRRFEEYSEPSPIDTTAYVLMHYASTEQSPGSTLLSLWRTLTSNELKRLARIINNLITYHPIGQKCARRLVELAEKYFDSMPRDVREKWQVERKSIEVYLT